MALRKITDVHEETRKSSISATRSHKRYRFQVAASNNPPRTLPWISQSKYAKVRKAQLSKPVSVGTFHEGQKKSGQVLLRGKTLWWLADRFYVELDDEGYPPGHERQNGVANLVKADDVRELSSRAPFPSFEKRFHFAIGTSKKWPATEPMISSSQYAAIAKQQSRTPVSVGIISGGALHGRTLWCFRGEFYVYQGYPLGPEGPNAASAFRELLSVKIVQEPFDKEVWSAGTTFRIGHRSGDSRTSPLLSAKEYRRAKKLQLSQPVSVGKLSSGKHRDKTLWWYQDEFYVENDGYTSEEVQLLLWEKEKKRRRKFQRLKKEMLSEHALEDARRERIPEDVRIFVWRRDEARCVQCGSQKNLEFDHMIPVSKGGGNTARNIQLLCETCNRRKSDTT